MAQETNFLSRIDITMTFIVAAAVGLLSAQPRSISVADPRPLAEAVKTFEGMFGFAVTYEDPRFVHASDLVQRQPRRNGAADLIPRGGPFTFSMAAAPRPKAAQSEIAQLVKAIVDQYEASGYPGRFDVLEEEDVVSVVPKAVRGLSGSFNPASSVLNTRISVRQQRSRTMLVGVQQVLDAVATATGQHINLGTAPSNFMMQTLMEDGAADTPARTVLLRAFHATGARVSWRMLYEPNDRFYAFNIHGLNEEQR